MPKRVNSTEARVRFGEMLRTVNDTNEPIIVEKNGAPVAVILSPADFHRLQNRRPSDWWQLVHESQRAFAPLRERGELPDPAELIHDEREKRDQQLLQTMHQY